MTDARRATAQADRGPKRQQKRHQEHRHTNRDKQRQPGAQRQRQTGKLLALQEGSGCALRGATSLQALEAQVRDGQPGQAGRGDGKQADKCAPEPHGLGASYGTPFELCPEMSKLA